MTTFTQEECDLLNIKDNCELVDNNNVIFYIIYKCDINGFGRPDDYFNMSEFKIYKHKQSIKLRIFKLNKILNEFSTR
jgi:hypothetical protein